MTNPQPCPFCTLPPERILHRNSSGVVIRDGYPISAGHSLIIPHLHIHLIPRYHGDLADPRGGVRWIIPAKADYWSKP